MQKISFRQLLITLCALGILGSLLTGGVGLITQTQQDEALQTNIIASQALRNSVEIDMMHDALRADVLNAYLAIANGDKTSGKQINDDARNHNDRFIELLSETEGLPVEPEIRIAIAEIKPTVKEYLQAGQDITQLALTDPASAQSKRAGFERLFKKLEFDLEKTSDIVSSSIESSKKGIEKKIAFYRILSAAVLIISVIILATTGTLITRRVLRQLGGDPGYACEVVNLVRSGKLDTQIHYDAETPNSLLAAVDKMRAALKENIDQITTAARESTRIKNALDVCQANVMVANENMEIIYLNSSVKTMMHNAESDLRKDLPNFNADRLMGANVDIFHKNPSHQRHMMTSLESAFKTSIRVGGRVFDLIATPVFDDTRKRIGTVVEWNDITAALARREEEQSLANENARIKQALDNVATNTMIADADNVIIYMNNAIQQMMSKNGQALRATIPRFNANTLMGNDIGIFQTDPLNQRNTLAGLKSTLRSEIKVAGLTFDLTVNPILDKTGQRIGTVVEWADRTQEVAIEEEIKNLVAAAVSGDFSHKMNVDNKQGFFNVLGELLNEFVQSTQGVVNDVSRVFSALARGDLSQRIDHNYRGAFLQLKNDANTTCEKLNEVVTSILGATDTIMNGATEIAAGNSDLSQRTEEQASSLEETASSMEEMTSSVKQAAQNAQKANQRAQDARTRAAVGGEVVDQTVAAMQSISKSSKDISDIIGVIDEIAFQTNLLALNAAVEAARAGDQGRGFAVVAGEVRNLAQRSSSAAKQISTLIKDSAEKVSHGTDLVNRSGNSLRDIIEVVDQVTRMMQEIAQSAKEQQSGIEQVNIAISQMDEMTQQNAALVEQATAASEQMSQQASEMADIVSFFKADVAQPTPPQTAGRLVKK